MGLDIFIAANNYHELHSGDYFDKENDYFHKHSLSRTFCNFMCRQNVISHEPELDQIGRISGVDISSIYEMESYPEEEGLNFQLEMAESEAERQSILEKAEGYKGKLHGNIDRVLNTIIDLIDKLSAIDNLPLLLLPTNFDSLRNKEYFADLNVDNGEGYIENNFGQDLRNFRSFLEFAKARGTTTVWFNYG